MKKYKAEDLEKEIPELYNEVLKGVEIVVPVIYEHVAHTLDNQPTGTVAVHSTFFRIEGDDKKMVYVEVVLEFTLVFKFMFKHLAEVRLHDSFQEYEEARKKVMAFSEQEFGDSLKAVSQYGGMKIKANPRDN